MPAEPNREETVFAAVLRLSTDERAAFLDRACAGNVALRAEVESLLAAHAEAGTFIDKPVSGQETVQLSTKDLLPPSEQSGERIGRFKLLEKIGEGGFGDVWMAEQEAPVRRRVALKIIKLGMDTREVIARFEAERQALALMDHPNIARVFDGGATDTGRPYVVMELVRGVPITRYCDDRRLSTRERMELFAQVCQAVQHAHQKGVIHRDLKPSNILVTELDGSAVPKVIDFGVARATEHRLTEKTLFTRFGQMIGTPAYMSPEQAGLGGLDIDTRSDVYSLGVVLYELLTGRTPFDPKKLLEAGYDAILKTIREVEPPKPSTKLSTLSPEELSTTAQQRRSEPQKLNRLIRGELDWIVMKCLEKVRTRRYETANDLATDLQRHLNNEPVVAAPPSAAYRLRRFARRHRVALATTSAFVSVLLGGIVMSTWQAWRANRFAREAITQRQTATNETARATSLFVKAEAARNETEAALYTTRVGLAYQAWEKGDVEEAERLLDACPVGLRHFEWHYLKRQCHQELLAFDAKPADHKWTRGSGSWYDFGTLGGQLVFSPNGNRLCVDHWSFDSAVFDAATGRSLLTVSTNRRVGVFARDGSSYFTPPLKDMSGVVLDVTSGRERPLDLPATETPWAFVTSANATWGAARRTNGIEVISITDGRVAEFLPSTKFFTPHAISSDGRWLVTYGSVGRDSYTVWDVQKLEPVLEIPFGAQPHVFEFDRDNRKLAVGGPGPAREERRRDYAVGVWDLRSAKQLFLRTVPSRMANIAFSADQRLLIAFGWRDEAESPESRTWDVLLLNANSGDEVMSLRADNEAGHGDRLVVVGNQYNPYEGMNVGVSAVASSSDGRHLALGVMDRTVQVVETTAPFRRRILRGHRSPVCAVAFSPDSMRLASLDRRGFVKVWDLQEPTPLRFEAAGLDGVWPDKVSVSRDGFLIVWSATNDNAAQKTSAMNLRTRERVELPVTPRDDFRDLFAIDQERFATAEGIWDISLGQRITRFAGRDSIGEHIAVSRDGRLMAGLGESSRIDWRTMSNSSGGLDVRDVQTGERITRIPDVTNRSFGGPFPYHDGSAYCCFSPNGRQMAVVARSETAIHVQRLGLNGDAAGEVCRFRGAQPVVFGPDGSWLLTGRQEGGFQKVDADSGAILREYDLESEVLRNSVAGWELSPDGRLAVCYTDNLPVLDLETGKTVYETGALPWRVWGSFSPDGRRLAVPGRDGFVRLWSLETHSEVARLPVRGAWVRFTADGDQLVVISPEGELRVLDGSSWDSDGTVTARR